MKYIDEYRNKKLAGVLSKKIKEIMPLSGIRLMEVCGTHTHNFFRFGLDKILPQSLKLISGPGCPVCVSPQEYIDKALSLVKNKDVIIATFGDMIRIPGTSSTLEKERARFGNVRAVYSPLDSLQLAKNNPDKKIVFLGVGFETTIPTIAISILLAKKEKLKNIYFLNSLKLIPPALDFLMKDKSVEIDGFLCPGHVSAIIGTNAYEFIPRKYKIGCCIAGFEPLDILEGIYLLVQQKVRKKAKVLNQYSRVVTSLGNKRALGIIKRVFTIKDSSWRGLGIIPGSGLEVRKELSCFDADKHFSLKTCIEKSGHKKTRCRCGDVLKGKIQPDECRLFRRLCTPENPYGPCMVSNEGACNAYYKYH
ncbi:MAG: hydrogenase formation protein HypD [Candidatus Omnitrophica bacterium]|nr:hydrogenase formation protein HypD [Candidatus Omnitrophota bacterium]